MSDKAHLAKQMVVSEDAKCQRTTVSGKGEVNMGVPTGDNGESWRGRNCCHINCLLPRGILSKLS